MLFYSKELLVLPYAIDTVLLEQTTSGTSTITLATGVYEITAVSGGSGASSYDTGNAWWYFTTGASGGYYKGTIRISAGTYTWVVGAGSSGVHSLETYPVTSSGGSTSLGSFFVLSGGRASDVGSAVSGGSLTTCTGEVTRTSYSQGNSSVMSGISSTEWSHSQINAPTLTSYGWGGAHYSWGDNRSGGSGYLKIVYKGA